MLFVICQNIDIDIIASPVVQHKNACGRLGAQSDAKRLRHQFYLCIGK